MDDGAQNKGVADDTKSTHKVDHINNQTDHVLEGAVCEDGGRGCTGLTIPYDDYAGLRDKYNALIQQCANLQKANDKLIVKWREGKEQIKTWKVYHDRSLAKERSKVRALGIDCENGLHKQHVANAAIGGILENGPKTPMSLNTSPMPSLPYSVASNVLTKGSPLLCDSASQVHGINNNRATASTTSSSDKGAQERIGALRSSRSLETLLDRADETEGEALRTDELAIPKSTNGFNVTTGGTQRSKSSSHSSDLPAIISERSLKRKRASTKEKSVSVYDDVVAHSPGSMAKPIRIKSEQCSSSPVSAIADREAQLVHDSLDLDEVGARLITPRKRRRLQELLRLSQAGMSSPDMRLNGQEARWPTTSNEEFRARDPDATPSADLQLRDDMLYNSAMDRNTKDHPGNLQHLGTAIASKERQKTEVQEAAQAALDLAVPRKLRGSHNQKMARQWLHNNDAHLRRMNRIGSVATSPKAISSAAGDSLGKIHGRPSLRGITAKKQPVRSFSEPPDAGVFQRDGLQSLASVTNQNTKALQPIDPNLQVLPRTGDARSTAKHRSARSRLDRVAVRVSTVTEDGDNDSSNDLPIKKKGDSESLEAKQKTLPRYQQDKTDVQIHKRLVNLLDEPSPQKPVLSPENLPPMASKSSSRSPSKATAHLQPRKAAASHVGQRVPDTSLNETHHRRAEAKGAKCRNLLATGPYLNLHLIDEPGDVLPEHEPLRARPVHRLGPDHFKINPAYNQGVDYAFTEVVRKHEQRKCLPGCTRPECCGSKFRKLVELGGLPTPRRSDLWNTSPSDDAADDEQLLADYLGENRGRLKQITEDKKRELLLEAKTRYFADKHGKHRQAYERRSTPPGFWRTDMPTTQEMEEDREASRKMERVRVEELYREAMRPGGRWMFRDE